MSAKSAKAFFHDDGRICLLYSTYNFWEMRSISMNADSKDHFVFGYFDPRNPGFVLIVLNFVHILLVLLV